MTMEYQHGERHIYRCIADEHLLVALSRTDAAPLFALTPTGVAVWQRMDRWTSLDELTGHLAQRFDVERDVASADIRNFLEQLDTIGALRTRAEAA